MLVNTNKISEKGLQLTDTIDLAATVLLEENSYFMESLDYEMVLRREESRIRARGKIKTTVSLVCVRCADPFEFKVNSTFDIILFPIEMMSDKGTSLNPDDMEYIFYEGDQIDVEKILSEQVNLFIPTNPICSSQCRGICPTCGINLNRGTCNCEEPRHSITFLFEKSTKR